MRDALNNLPKTKATILNSLLPAIENIGDSYEETSKKELKGQKIKKFALPSKIIDIYTRLENLLGLKLSGHTDTLTKTSNLIDEI